MQLDWRAIAGPALAAATTLTAIAIDHRLFGIPNPAALLVCMVAFAGSDAPMNAKEIETYMAANIKRAEETNSGRWYYPILMKGEWPVLLNIMGKGEGDERYLSVAEVRTLFVERRFPDKNVARLPSPPGS